MTEEWKGNEGVRKMPSHHVDPHLGNSEAEEQMCKRRRRGDPNLGSREAEYISDRQRLGPTQCPRAELVASP